VSPVTGECLLYLGDAFLVALVAQQVTEIQLPFTRLWVTDES
jgi:hypothetical protein